MTDDGGVKRMGISFSCLLLHNVDFSGTVNAMMSLHSEKFIHRNEHDNASESTSSLSTI